MRRFITIAPLLFCTVTLLQSCKKNEQEPAPAGSTSATVSGAISKSSGLGLNKIGDSGFFQVLNDAGSTAGIPGYTNNNNDTIGLAAYEGTAYQKWKITNVGDGYFTIMNKGSGKYLEAGSAGQLVVNRQTGSDAQLWNLQPLSGMAYKALSKTTGLAITSVAGGITLMSYKGLPAQVWGYNRLPGSEPAAATFTVSGLLQSNMVIQRDKPFQVWGKTTAGVTVNVKASWNTALFSAVADASGNWKLFVPAAGANNVAQTLTCSADGVKPVKFTNVLIGDVWIGAGQSNMQMPLNRQDNNFGGFHGVYNYQAEIAAANYPHIRMMVIRAASSSTPTEDLSNPGSWVVCNPTNAAAANFSATAYFFARKLQTTLPGNVPIGVVVSAVGATYIEQWASAETIAKDPVTQSYYAGKHGSSGLYNAMIYSLKKLAVKGFIWYQGEQNSSDVPVSNYTLLHRNLIKDWRTLFNQGTLPFYYVQLPPLGTLFADSTRFGNALFREAQANVRTVEKTGFACIMDTNEPFNIHNIYKQQVGDRLGLLALQNDYGQPVQSLGPQYESYTQNGNTITVTFKNADGLTTNNKPQPQYFYVASATDKKFLKGNNVVVNGNTISFTVPVNGLKVDALRYAFTEIAVTHINNSEGLPMEPFRTDNW